MKSYRVSVYDSKFFFIKQTMIFTSWWDYIKFRIKHRKDLVLVEKVQVR